MFEKLVVLNLTDIMFYGVVSNQKCFVEYKSFLKYSSAS